jgi:hypothetical protein
MSQPATENLKSVSIMAVLYHVPGYCQALFVAVQTSILFKTTDIGKLSFLKQLITPSAVLPAVFSRICMIICNGLQCGRYGGPAHVMLNSHTCLAVSGPTVFSGK